MTYMVCGQVELRRLRVDVGQCRLVVVVVQVPRDVRLLIGQILQDTVTDLDLRHSLRINGDVGGEDVIVADGVDDVDLDLVEEVVIDAAHGQRGRVASGRGALVEEVVPGEQQHSMSVAGTPQLNICVNVFVP